jgi:molecular chaperone DnaK
MFDDVADSVAGSEFGREALSKAKEVIVTTKEAISSKDLEQLQTCIETLKRTLKMFKGVLAQA